MNIIKMEQGNVINNILSLMQAVEGFVDLKGDEKENYVLKQLNSNLGDESYERYKPIFPLIIEFIVLLSKRKIKLDINNIRKYCCNLL
jgi:hypothetical protein